MPNYAPEPTRSTGSLTITFGLVSIPLKLYSSIETIEGVKRRQYSPAGNPIGLKPYDKVTGADVPTESIVKKVAVGDTLVDLTDDEIEQQTAPHVQRGVAAVEAFVSLDLLGSRYQPTGRYQARPAPIEVGKTKRPNPAADKSFALFMAVMAEERVGALMKIALRGPAKYAVLTPDGNLIPVLYDAEIRDARPAPDVELSAKELQLGRQLVKSVGVRELDLEDTGTEALLDYIEKKAKGETPEVTEPVAPVGDVVDLMAMLEASVEAVKPKAKKAPAARKKAA